MTTQLRAPYLAWLRPSRPSTRVRPRRPMAPPAMSQRMDLTRSRSRRKSPSTTKSTSPSSSARSCLKREEGAEEAVTARERVERKKAMVSISKPTLCVARMARK